MGLALVCGFVFTESNGRADNTRGSDTVVAPPSRRGTWVWSKASWLEPVDRDALFGLLKRQGISVILVQIHTDYTGKEPALDYGAQLSALLDRAEREGVVVHALDGAPDFIYPPWPGKLSGQIRAIAKFNESRPPKARIAGVHYDIEPYTLAAFKKDDQSRVEVCNAYVAALKTLAPVAREHKLEFSVDIPFWFDTNTRLKPVEADAGGVSLLDRVAHIVDWFGIMAYRNTASGPDGILVHSEGEIQIMGKLGKKAWIGVETGPNKADDPPKITFANRTVTDCERELKEIELQMAGQKGYGGLLIHSYERYREYLKKAATTQE